MPSLAKIHPKHHHHHRPQPNTPLTPTQKRTQAKLSKAATYRTTELTIRAAISSFRTQLLAYEHGRRNATKPSMSQIAKDFHVPYQRCLVRMRGRDSKSERWPAMSRLTEKQERVVVQWCVSAFGDGSGGAGDEQRVLKEIKACANRVLRGECGDETGRVSSAWARRFWERHPEIWMREGGRKVGGDVVVAATISSDRSSLGFAGHGQGGQCLIPQSANSTTCNCEEVQRLQAVLEMARKENEKLVARVRELEGKLKEKQVIEEYIGGDN